ncbi:MAG: dephospho-CoA kinase [Aquificaceae bacterium]
MKDWGKYKQKVEELKAALDKALSGLDVEYELKTPEDADFDVSFKVPYLSIRYYTDEEHFHERKIELFDYYFGSPTEETLKLIKDMVEEFLMEIEQSEYGGG